MKTSNSKWLRIFITVMLSTLCLNADDNELIFESSHEAKSPLELSLECQKRDVTLKPYTSFLVSTHFVLRPLFPSDHTALSEFFMDPDAVRYYFDGQTRNAQETESLIKDRATWTRDGEDFRWSLITREGIVAFCFIGKLGVERVDLGSEWGEIKTRELAYGAVRRVHGRGLIPEASKLGMEFVGGAFKATAHAENKPSRAVLKKIGFIPNPRRQNVYLEDFKNFRNGYMKLELEQNVSAEEIRLNKQLGSAERFVFLKAGLAHMRWKSKSKGKTIAHANSNF